MEPTMLEKLQKNIFPGAWEAIENPQMFLWHMNSRNKIDTFQNNSSQALAIDVFGSLKVAGSKEQILNTMAQRLGLPSSALWSIKLEWTEHGNPLREKRLSQIDAAAITDNTIILFECKFTETAGCCSQPEPIIKGSNKGLKQCNGNYENQVNPVDGVCARCALTTKGIRYWEYISEIFDFRADMDYRPCPFKGNWYQLMRNLTMAAALKKETKKKTAAVIIYADTLRTKTTEWLASDDWNIFRRHIKPGAIPFNHWSYSALLKIIQEADPKNHLWIELDEWVKNKCKIVSERS